MLNLTFLKDWLKNLNQFLRFKGIEDLMSRRVITKIEPNKPCPCGSGKKYKKCCQGKNRRELFKSQFLAYWRQSLSVSSPTSKIFGLLLVTDLVFIILHVLCAHTRCLSNVMFLITADGGYGEIFQYIKEFWIVL